LTSAAALASYEEALRNNRPLALRTADENLFSLDIDRWLGPVDAADLTVLDRCFGPVLDIGCGPGRITAALQQRGVDALGIDIAHIAVSLTRGRGGYALRRNVFWPVPDEGSWATALLLDGNIGIGGEPTRLLRRIADLLAPDGRLIAEIDADATTDVRHSVRFAGTPDGSEFDWALVGVHALTRYAHLAGLAVTQTWPADGRVFAVLTRATSQPVGQPG
jgi:SAM-dependent methyltransferase